MASHGECAFLWCALNKSTRNTSNLLMEVPYKFHEPTCGQSRGEALASFLQSSDPIHLQA
eukprot:symbB.v1.2.036741.t1/scaffold5256.1/size29320/1